MGISDFCNIAEYHALHCLWLARTAGVRNVFDLRKSMHILNILFLVPAYGPSMAQTTKLASVLVDVNPALKSCEMWMLWIFSVVCVHISMLYSVWPTKMPQIYSNIIYNLYVMRMYVHLSVTFLEFTNNIV